MNKLVTNYETQKRMRFNLLIFRFQVTYPVNVTISLANVRVS